MSDTPNVRPQAPQEPGAERPAGTVARPTVNDVIRFLCELFAFGSLAVWGFVAWPFAWNILVGIATPVIAILIWALFVSPKAVVRMHPFARAVVELLVYASATMAWWSLGQAWVGIVFAVVAVTTGLINGLRKLG